MNGKIGDIKFEQNSDGSFTLTWDRNDPQWSFLNHLTSKEIQIMLEEAIRESLKENDK